MSQRARGLLITAGLVALHVPPLALLVTGVRPIYLAFLATSYVLTVLVLSGGLHRYFAHRAFATSRPLQFGLALGGAMFFGDAVSFAGRHRLHHRHSDTDADVHSPRAGAWYCWLGHVLAPKYSEEAMLRAVPDLTCYPELMWLHRYWLVPGLVTAGLVLLLGGWAAFAAGFCTSGLIALYVVSTVNYVCHLGGPQRYDTGDHAVNNPILGLVTFGEGWHNNHHHCPGSARIGFFWWEVDVIYYVLRGLGWLGLVWDVREVPDAVRHGQDHRQDRHQGGG
jgi:stearoyl-CoA desaturase (delta-9 desaturase)